MLLDKNKLYKDFMLLVPCIRMRCKSMSNSLSICSTEAVTSPALSAIAAEGDLRPPFMVRPQVWAMPPLGMCPAAATASMQSLPEDEPEPWLCSTEAVAAAFSRDSDKPTLSAGKTYLVVPAEWTIMMQDYGKLPTFNAGT